MPARGDARPRVCTYLLEFDPGVDAAAALVGSAAARCDCGQDRRTRTWVATTATGRLLLVIEHDEPDIRLPARPLVDAVDAYVRRTGRGILSLLPDGSARRQWYRIVERGWVALHHADEIAVTVLDRALDELYGPDELYGAVHRGADTDAA